MYAAAVYMPLTASPDGEINDGIADANEERRRSDVQNMLNDLYGK